MNQPTSLPNFIEHEFIPAIAQDASTGQVLMLAYMNSDAYAETMRSGYAVYFSRSRARLWRKGEESGHRQRVISMHLDCDGDTLLLRVEQVGAACHEGYRTCFFRQWSSDQWETTEPRLVDPRHVYRSQGDNPT